MIVLTVLTSVDLLSFLALGGLPQVFLEPHEAPWSLQDPSLQWAIPGSFPLLPELRLPLTITLADV